MSRWAIHDRIALRFPRFSMAAHIFFANVGLCLGDNTHEALSTQNPH
jgi:hypothetical protein